MARRIVVIGYGAIGRALATDLAARAARIIKNLRAFARNEADESSDLDLLTEVYYGTLVRLLA